MRHTESFGFYVVTNLMTLNDDVSGLSELEYLLNGVLGLEVAGDTIQFVGIVTNSTRVYLVVTVGVFPGAMIETIDLPAPRELAWYVQPETAVLVLVAWLIGPVAIGVGRFERADIT